MQKMSEKETSKSSEMLKLLGEFWKAKSLLEKSDLEAQERLAAQYSMAKRELGEDVVAIDQLWEKFRVDKNRLVKAFWREMDSLEKNHIISKENLERQYDISEAKMKD